MLRKLISEQEEEEDEDERTSSSCCRIRFFDRRKDWSLYIFSPINK